MDYLDKMMTHRIMIAFYLIAIWAIMTCNCFGFDSGAVCSEKTQRRGRAQLLKSIPCDLSIQAYCNLPGSMYPWNAVRRFVSENQGMMKRMYGDVRHISVLRNEINDNEITLDDVEEAAVRYSRASWKRNKYLHQESSKSKNNDLLSEVHYRRGSNPHSRSRSTARTTKKSTQQTESSSSAPETPANTSSATSASTIISSTTNKTRPTEKREKMAIISAKQTKPPSTLPSEKKPEYEQSIEAAIEEIFIQFNDNSNKNGINNYLNDTVQSTSSETTVETTTNIFDENIEVMGILSNKSETAPTISTTLRIYGFLKDEKVTTIAPIEQNTTENSTIKADELRSEQTSSTVKNHVNDNLVQTENEDTENMYSNGQDDSIPQESIKKETIIVPNDNFDNYKPDRNQKPFDEQIGGQLFQDVAEKEDPLLLNSRGVNACPVKEEVVAPFWANNTRGEVLALLNLYPFEQYVHWEKCTQEHKQMYCRDGCRCEQQYRLHRLLAYDPHNECRGIFSDWFRFPSCCICKCYNIPFEYRVTSRSPRSMNRPRTSGNRKTEKLIRNRFDEEEIEPSSFDRDQNEWYRKEAYSADDIEDIFVDDVEESDV